jgi:hypothetical protein
MSSVVANLLARQVWRTEDDFPAGREIEGEKSKFVIFKVSGIDRKRKTRGIRIRQ